jgi:hypothetical protein
MRQLVLGFSLLVACGGSAQQADSADDVGESEAETTDLSGESDMPPDPDAVAEEGSAEPSSAPVTVSDEELTKILQLVLDDEALQPYLHLEEPERMPLKVHGDVLPPGLSLTMARKPVQYVDSSVVEDKKKAVLVFTSIEVKGERVTVSFRYDIEKVRGSATVAKSDGRWQLEKSRISERDYQPSAN